MCGAGCRVPVPARFVGPGCGICYELPILDLGRWAKVLPVAPALRTPTDHRPRRRTLQGTWRRDDPRELRKRAPSRDDLRTRQAGTESATRGTVDRPGERVSSTTTAAAYSLAMATRFGDFVMLCEILAEHTGRSISTVSRHATGSGETIARLRRGHAITIRRADRAIRFFSEHWPDAVAWPTDMPRPAQARSPTAASPPQDGPNGAAVARAAATAPTRGGLRRASRSGSLS